MQAERNIKKEFMKNIWKALFGKKQAEETATEDAYAAAYSRIKEAMSHGHLLNGAYSEDVDVELWLPEMNGVNVTIFCDRLLCPKHGDTLKGVFVLMPEETRNISELNIELQSSGFRLAGKENIPDHGEALFLRVDTKYVKDNLLIPNEWKSGFDWGENFVKSHINYYLPLYRDKYYKKVPTSQYGQRYILNFSVCGEFNMDVYFVPDGTESFVWILSKGFCCK